MLCTLLAPRAERPRSPASTSPRRRRRPPPHRGRAAGRRARPAPGTRLLSSG
jgi:hypothetical protein